LKIYKWRCGFDGVEAMHDGDRDNGNAKTMQMMRKNLKVIMRVVKSM